MMWTNLNVGQGYQDRDPICDQWEGSIIRP